MTDSNTGTAVQIGGKTLELVGQFETYDQLVERVRERAADIGLSYRLCDEISGLAEGHTGKVLADLRAKQMGIGTFLAITRTLGIRGVLYVDPALVREVAPLWEVRDAIKAHPRSAKRFGQTTMKRILPVAAAEMGQRGGARRRELPPETRRALAQAAARARWQRRNPRA
jgi:hypothetical protein